MIEINHNRIGFEKNTDIKLGKSLYEGDGEVFELKGDKTKVVKINWTEDKTWVEKRLKMLKKLKKLNNGAVVKLHQVGTYRYTHTIEYPQYDTTKPPIQRTYDYFYYYYVMDRVHPGVSAYDVEKIESAIYADSYARTTGRIRSFIKKARQLPYSYNDFHSGNIYVSKRGALKFIDLESFMI